MAGKKFQRPVRRNAVPDPKPPRWAPYLQMLPSLLQALIMAGVAYFVTSRVEQALKERQATVASVTAMTQLLKDIDAATGDGREGQRKSLARQLSMYGVDAIGPLVILAVDKDMEIAVPEEGLTLIAIRHKAEVCAALGNLLRSREQFPDAVTQMKSLERRTKDLGCMERVKTCAAR